jgi:hypothetical protein
MSTFSHARRSVRAMAVAGAVATGLSLVTIPSIAQADTAGCITKQEFRKVHRGMSKAKVRRIADTGGRQQSFFTIGRARYETREYRSCRSPRWSIVSVDFKNGRMNGKFAYWG